MKTILIPLFFLSALSARAQTCGYPGDANNDGRADYLDLIAVGLAYGAASDPRSVQGNEWMLNCFVPWPGSIPGAGVNPGFADANGDGLVDSLDVDAIVINYDSLQTEPAIPPPAPYAPDTLLDSPCALFVISYDEDPNDPQAFFANIDLFVDPSGFPGAMAAGMRLVYPTSPAVLIEDSTRVIFDPADVDLMGVGAATLRTTLQRQLPPGIVEFAVSGRGNNALMAPRRLSRIKFVITKDVIIRADTLQFSLKPESAYVITETGLRICSEFELGSIALIVLTPAREPQSDGAFFLFPNPAGAFFGIGARDLDRKESVQRCRLYASGRLVGEYLSGFERMPVQHLPGGLYTVEIVCKDAIYRKKLLIH